MEDVIHARENVISFAVQVAAKFGRTSGLKFPTSASSFSTVQLDNERKGFQRPRPPQQHSQSSRPSFVNNRNESQHTVIPTTTQPLQNELNEPQAEMDLLTETQFIFDRVIRFTGLLAVYLEPSDEFVNTNHNASEQLFMKEWILACGVDILGQTAQVETLDSQQFRDVFTHAAATQSAPSVATQPRTCHFRRKQLRRSMCGTLCAIFLKISAQRARLDRLRNQLSALRMELQQSALTPTTRTPSVMSAPSPTDNPLPFHFQNAYGVSLCPPTVINRTLHSVHIDPTLSPSNVITTTQNTTPAEPTSTTGSCTPLLPPRAPLPRKTSFAGDALVGNGATRRARMHRLSLSSAQDAHGTPTSALSTAPRRRGLTRRATLSTSTAPRRQSRLSIQS
jgi:hypothetical protein